MKRLTVKRALELVRAELRAEAFIRDAKGRSFTAREVFDFAGTLTIERIAEIDAEASR